MAKRRPPVAIESTLVVVEGEGEEAFCLYLKTLTRGSGKRFVIKNAHGGSPDKQVDYAKRLCAQADYDQLALLVDDDLPMTKTRQDWIRRNGVTLIRSQPCLEAEWLRLQHQAPANDVTQCQRQAARHAGQPGIKEIKSMLAARDHWINSFPIEDLQAQRATHPWLNAVLDIFSL